jgi:hypothetical protein
MKRSVWMIAGGLQVLALAGCVPAVMGTTVVARPGYGKSAADFASDHSLCTTQANQQIAAARNAANGQILGAALGGADLGTTSATATATTASLQQQLDAAYSACMYARGENVPGYAVASEPVPDYAPHRTYHRTTPASAPASASSSSATPASSSGSGGGFVEPPPSAPAATPASSGGFAEPPPSQH